MLWCQLALSSVQAGSVAQSLDRLSSCQDIISVGLLQHLSLIYRWGEGALVFQLEERRKGLSKMCFWVRCALGDCLLQCSYSATL
jgi:hypothetical protein